MGRKSGAKQSLKSPKSSGTELSSQKLYDLQQNNDKLLRVTSVEFRQVLENHSTIEKLLRKTISLESEIDPGFPCRNKTSVEELTSWMLKHNAKIDGVEILELDNFDYGIVAMRDFVEGELIISVPRKLMMSTESAGKSELEDLIRTDPILMHMPNVILALFVLLEKFKEPGTSFWAPYISCLPSSYTTVMYFSGEELAALKGSPVYEPSLKQCQNIARQYVYLRNLFHKSSDPASLILRKYFTYEQYRWAVSTVMTRQNFIPANSLQNPMVLALIPWWDMGNHDNGELTTDFDLKTDSSMYRTCRAFNAGDQVFMSYGKRPNSELFLHNGFVHAGNQSDGVKLRLGVSKSDPLVNLKYGLLKDLAIPSSAEFLLAVSTKPYQPVGKFLAFLRIFNMDQADLEEWSRKEDKDELMQPEPALAVDAKVKNFLTTRIKLILSAYPTSLKEDENLIEERDLLPCMKLAVLLRITEKRLLTKTMADLQNIES